MGHALLGHQRDGLSGMPLTRHPPSNRGPYARKSELLPRRTRNEPEEAKGEATQGGLCAMAPISMAGANKSAKGPAPSLRWTPIHPGPRSVVPVANLSGLEQWLARHPLYGKLSPPGLHALPHLSKAEVRFPPSLRGYNRSPCFNNEQILSRKSPLYCSTRLNPNHFSADG